MKNELVLFESKDGNIRLDVNVEGGNCMVDSGSDDSTI